MRTQEQAKRLFMWYKVKELSEENSYSCNKIAGILGIDRRTVSRYLSMSEGEFIDFISKPRVYKRLLSVYHPDVKKMLKVDQDLPAAQLIVIDDLMNIAVNREEGNLLFAFVNCVYESTSFIITTNKSPAQWARSLDDEVLATALLDRLLYKCELIQLSGKSYRMQNRKTIFNGQVDGM